MQNKKQLAVFEGKKIRCVWNDEKELWYFSVVDIVDALNASENPRNYWKILKNRLKQKGSEVVRKDLTNEWDKRGVKTNDEFAILTDDISFAWAGLKTKDYKKHKER